jgi:prepilin-type N-terminal cleavage/methylation domain-containing protein
MFARRAFSMVELVIVLVIVGVTSAIALPRYLSSTMRVKVDGAARKVVADIERLRDRARQQGREQRVYFGDAGYVLVTTDDSGAAVKEQVDLTLEPYRVGIKAQVMTDQGLTFDSLGRAGTPLVIYLTNGDHTRGVSFDPTSGKAEVFVPERMADGKLNADSVEMKPRVRAALGIGVKTEPLQPASATALEIELDDVIKK